MINSIITILLIVTISSCKFGNEKSNSFIVEKNQLNSNNSYDTLYFLCDSIITIDETRKIYNSYYDTIVIEKGIFSFLTYDYEQGYCENAIALTRSALLYEAEGQTKKAKENYQKIIDNYLAEQSSDTEKIHFSDSDLFATYKMNSSLLCSNAYYKNDNLDKAIRVLTPAINYHNDNFCRIHYKFIQLCIIKYGKERVSQEISNCVKTVHYKKENSCNDGWAVTIFGAEMSLDEDKLFEDANLTPNEVTVMLQKEEFTRLIH